MVGRGAISAGMLIAGLLLPLAAASPATPRLTEAQKIAIIRSLISEVGIARQALPPNKAGVELAAADGKVLNADDVRQHLLEDGNAAKVGDRVAITAITFKDDRIEFAINGGPHKTHWYNHIAIGMGDNVQPVSQPSQTGARGAEITLRYDHALPSLTPEEVKKELGPLIDWDPPAEAEEMVKALPPAVKAAIEAHKVLVGMDTDMVVAAMGRTGNKVRQTDAQGNETEDWIYGTPPAQTVFVRFAGDRVIRVTTYNADGTQIVDSTPDPALAARVAQQQQQAAERAVEASQPAPTLRRPGDAPPPGGPPVTGPPVQPPAQPPTHPPVCCGR